VCSERVCMCLFVCVCTKEAGIGIGRGPGRAARHCCVRGHMQSKGNYEVGRYVI
jgi:hypothetical protein